MTLERPPVTGIAPAPASRTGPDSQHTPVRAIVLMICAMAGFAASDSFIKFAGATVPPGQVILVLGLGGTAVFASLAARRGMVLVGRHTRHWAILLRMLAEAVGTMGFVIALTLASLSTVSAILQAAPLVVTLGAAVLLRESVGWRRWGAVLVGFVGVLIMLQPDPDGINAGALMALVAVAALSVRDLMTRFVPPGVPNLVLATYGFVPLIPAGLVLLSVTGGAVLPGPGVAAALLGMIVSATCGYFALTLSLRLGAMAVVAPYRYTRLIFAFALGAAVFGDRLTPPILIGASLVAGAGIYTFYRENSLRRQARRTAPPTHPS